MRLPDDSGRDLGNGRTSCQQRCAVCRRTGRCRRAESSLAARGNAGQRSQRRHPGKLAAWRTADLTGAQCNWWFGCGHSISAGELAQPGGQQSLLRLGGVNLALHRLKPLIHGRPQQPCPGRRAGARRDCIGLRAGRFADRGRRRSRTLILGSTSAALAVSVGIERRDRAPVLLVVVTDSSHTKAQSACRGRWWYRLLACTAQTCEVGRGPKQRLPRSKQPVDVCNVGAHRAVH